MAPPPAPPTVPPHKFLPPTCTKQSVIQSAAKQEPAATGEEEAEGRFQVNYSMQINYIHDEICSVKFEKKYNYNLIKYVLCNIFDDLFN